MGKQQFKVRIAAATLLLVTVACGGDDGDAETAENGNDAAAPTDEEDLGDDSSADGATGEVCTEDRVGGEITYGSGSPMRGLDPTVALGTGSSGGTELTALYDTLMRYDAGTGEYLPHVAEELTSNEDRTEWTLTLQDGLQFGNGDALTADAVEFSIERMADSSVAGAGLASAIDSMEVIDDHSIVLSTQIPHGQIPYVLSTEVGMVVNPAVVESMGPEDFSRSPEGAGMGPYELERFVPGEELVYTAKTDYWGGPVCIEQVRFVHIDDDDARFDSLRAGELQMAFLSDQQVIERAREAEFEAYSDVGGASGAFLFNHREDASTSDPRVRQAFAHALDTERLNERVNEGEALAATGIVDETQSVHPGIDGPEHDPDLAADLVEAAQADGWDGSVNLICPNDSSSTEQAITTEAMLEAVGFDVTVETLPYNEWSERWVSEHNFDASCYSLIVFDSGPLARLNQFYSTSPRTRTGMDNAAMDDALDDLQAAGTVEETTAAMGDIQEAWNDVVPMAAVWASDWFIAADSDVAGLVPTRDVVMMLHDAYLES